MAEHDLQLRVSAYSRAVAFGRALVPLGIGLSFVAVAIAQPFVDGPFYGRMAALVSAGTMGLAASCLGVLMVRAAFVRRANLVVGPDKLTIEHRGVLRAPMEIPLSEIKQVAVEDEPQLGPWLLRRDDRRFRVHGEERPPGMPEHLYARTLGSPFPLLSTAGDPPNVAVLFARPILLYPARRTNKILASIGPIHMVRPKQLTRGLLLRAKDPAEARDAFEGRGLVQSVSVEDVEAVAPDLAQHDRARARVTRAKLAVGALVLMNVSGPILVYGVGPEPGPAGLESSVRVTIRGWPQSE